MEAPVTGYRVWEYLKRHGERTTSEIVDGAGVSHSGTWHILRRLVLQGYVECTGIHRGSNRWIAVGNRSPKVPVAIQIGRLLRAQGALPVCIIADTLGHKPNTIHSAFCRNNGPGGLFYKVPGEYPALLALQPHVKYTEGML